MINTQGLVTMNSVSANAVSFLKKLASVSLLALIFAQAEASVPKTVETVSSLAGTYQCHGYDSHEGSYKDATVVLTLDTKNSDFAHNYGAYHFALVEPDGTRYTGEAASNGNNLAVYFENTDVSKKTDRGVGIAVVSHDKDEQGKTQTVFHKFYYEPAFDGGGNGYETCVKR